MDYSLRKSIDGGKMKEEIMKVESSDDEGSKEDMGIIQVKKEASSSAEGNNNLQKSSSTPRQLEDPLAPSKEEMSEVIQENQRLRTSLNKIMKDYQALQIQFHDILQQETTTKTTTSSPVNMEEPHDDLVSLSLGRTSSIDVKKTDTHIFTPNKEIENENDNGKGLTLGLGCKFETTIYDKGIIGESSVISPEEDIEEVKEENRETLPSQKILKRNAEDEISSQNPTKRARVSLRVRCDSQTMNDGCQWRKYGQKIAKGNPCPRAYYRCTVANNCPVRKQVQRCAEDVSILITTYEGTHNHPLPVAATAIASTTATAATMLLSGSSTSSSNIVNSIVPSTNINGLNYYFSADNSKSKLFHLPNSSISSSQSSLPTITLDLTSTSSSSSSLSPLTRMTSFSTRYPSTNLNFSSSSESSNSWSNGTFNYGASNSLNFQRQPFFQEDIYHNHSSKNMSFVPPDTLVETTKAITSDPSFQSALVVALSSFLCSTSRTNLEVLAPNQNFRIGDQSFPILSSFGPIGTNSQSGSEFSLHSSSSFPISKGKSPTPNDNKDHTS